MYLFVFDYYHFKVICEQVCHGNFKVCSNVGNESDTMVFLNFYV